MKAMHKIYFVCFLLDEFPAIYLIVGFFRFLLIMCPTNTAE